MAKKDSSAMIYGKVPPNALDAEKAVLGAVMLERGALAEVLDILKPAVFYSEAHQRVYEAILTLDSKSRVVNILTVVEELKRMGDLEQIGGAYFVTQLTNSVVSSAGIADHARIMVEKFMAREIIRVGGEMVRDGYDDTTDAFDLVDRSEKGIAGIMDVNDRGKITPIDTALAKTMQRIANLRQQDSSLTGVSSGFECMDRITHGWQDTDLIILAARPSVGKTALALNLARNAAMNTRKPIKTAFFSLEMSEGQLTQRLISLETGIWLEAIATGRLSDEQMEAIYSRGIGPLSRSGIFIDDTAALNIFELRAKCRRLKTKHKIGLVVVDYLQLMGGTGDKSNREQEISKISRDLKALAKELSLPIIALSQLSREVEKRNDKTPQLSDLRESGAIEQDADMVMFLYRPEYYDANAAQSGQSAKGETHVKIAKHRNGSLDTVKLTARLEIQKFVDFDGDTVTSGVQSSWRPIKMPYKEDEGF